MYCKNFVEDFTDKIIDKLSCPCGINNYTHYEMANCQMIQLYLCHKYCGMLNNIGYEDDFDYDHNEVYINCLITLLHNQQFERFLEMLGNLNGEKNWELDREIYRKLKEKIAKHGECEWRQNFNDKNEYYEEICEYNLI